MKAAQPSPEPKHGRLGVVASVCRRLENEEKEPTLENLAEDAGFSPGHLQKMFKAHVGLSPHEYAAAVRSGRLLEALRAGRTVTEAVYEAGYSAPSRAYTEWKERSAIPPGELRRGAPGQDISYAVVPGPLGWTLVAVTDRGVAAVFFNDEPAALPTMLRADFPDAQLREIPAGGSRILRRVLENLATPERAADLPLDIRGTAFQKLVWKALQSVPAGETATYGEIARRIGRPEAARAVARACAANKIALFIPCHRIIRSDGKIGGYRWGITRKKTVLADEQDDGNA